MLYPQDFNYLNTITANFKGSLFQLVSEFGPDYQANYIINLEDVKQATGRERITESMLSDYINYLNNHGFASRSDGRFIYLSVSARTVVPVGNEAIRLGNALNVFRTRAQMNGDYNNL